MTAQDQSDVSSHATVSRTTVVVSIVGVLAVVSYAVWAGVHILVVNPLAAVPGRSLGEIYAAMADAGQSFSMAWVLGFLGFGVALVVASAWVCIAAKAPPVVAASGPVSLLILGAPAYFIASFGPGMSLADTYGVSGGSHSPWHLPLYATSGLAALAVIIVPIIVALRSRARRARRPLTP